MLAFVCSIANRPLFAFADESLAHILLYLLLGIGTRGGYPFWCPLIQNLWILVFPVHACCFDCWHQYGHTIRAFVFHENFIGTLIVLIIWFVLAALA